MEKKRIEWITPDCFIDVDIYIIKELSIDYSIYWTIIESPASSSDNIQYVSNILKKKENKIHICFEKQEYKLTDPRNILFQIRIIRTAKSHKPDFYYISSQFQPYGVFIYKLFIPSSKTIYACHNVTTPKGAKNEKFMKIYTKIWLSFAKNINVFSRSQKAVLETKYQYKNILYAPLAIKDYGEPSLTIDKFDKTVVRFLSFGNIVEYKRLDLLIEAGNILYDRGFRNFSIRIAGSCKDWGKYNSMIKHPEIFDLRIRRIANEDVPNLFADCHYFVMPYQDIAQSGAITVAFRYNLPTIVSDIEPFEEFVQDSVTGITFKSMNVVDLADKMQYAIEHFSTIYKPLCNGQKRFVDKELSIQSIIERYKQFLLKLQYNH